MYIYIYIYNKKYNWIHDRLFRQPILFKWLNDYYFDFRSMYSAEIKNNWPVLQMSNAKTWNANWQKKIAILQELRNKQYKIK